MGKKKDTGAAPASRGAARDSDEEAAPVEGRSRAADGMMRGDLSSSYGYADPATSEFKYYGPGTDIEFPKGLGYTLGMKGSAE